LKENEIHTFWKTFNHSIDVIEGIKTEENAYKDKYIRFLKELLDIFKVKSNEETVVEGYEALMKRISEGVHLK